MFSCLSKGLMSRSIRPILQAPLGLDYCQERNLTNRRSKYQTKMGPNNKHRDPNYRKLRALKVIKVDLPDFHEEEVDMSKLTAEQIRSKLKERGLQPPRPWQERQPELSCTGEIVDPYVPPEGDGKASLISTDFAKEKVVRIEKKSKSWFAARKIRSFEEEFDAYIFAREEATSIYIKMHEAMMTKDEFQIGKYATEKALQDILLNLELKTMRWKFLESIEPPRVVHIRAMDIISKDNVFAQITCRLHTKQTLALYDRFGRLMYGNELTPKDVLEYVVFEKHLSDLYGSWRVHGKIQPTWSGVGHDLQYQKTSRLQEAAP